MTRLLALGITVMIMAYLYFWVSKGRFQTAASATVPQKKKKRKKIRPGEMWTQVYETADREEARTIQMRLEEQDISVTVFEQAKKSLTGETPPGFGLVVPKDQSAYAQQLIFRYLEHSDNPGESGEQKKD